MTYDDIVNRGFAWIGFIYPDRVILIKTTSVKPEDLAGWHFTNMVKNRMPMFAQDSISQSIASDALLS
jgi:hypothetical protein